MQELSLLDRTRKRALFAQYGPDLVRMQQRGLDWRRVERQARRLFDYHRTARAIEQRIDADRELLQESTWRDVTRRLWDQHWWRSRSLDNVALLVIATRQRLTMQHFVKRLRRLVERARRRVRQRL